MENEAPAGKGSLAWGGTMVFVSVSVLAYIGYDLMFTEEPGYPLWWGVILIAFWANVTSMGIRRIRAARRGSE